ncbi:hypothetical protein [Wolbachia endosymbiont of Tettigetta isshikii]|uniref:hypothetical protein n=1 Tax=Wolbachia endosymbiont of Tettigetta isshikii TaxID=3239093 RepID=UPI0039802396
MNNYKEKREQWKRENTNPGGGIFQQVKGTRYDDHSHKAKEIQERKRQSEQRNNSGSSMSR